MLIILVTKNKTISSWLYLNYCLLLFYSMILKKIAHILFF